MVLKQSADRVFKRTCRNSYIKVSTFAEICALNLDVVSLNMRMFEIITGVREGEEENQGYEDIIHQNRHFC